MAKPMKHSDTVNGVASVQLRADFPHLGQRHRFVGFVFEVERRPAMRLVAHKPVEGDDRAILRVAHATNDQSLEAWGSGGALRYRLTREGPRWFEGQLDASRGGAELERVAPRWTPPAAAAQGDQSDVMGKALIAPLVERMLQGIRTGQTPSPSLVDGLRAQSVLDAALESARRGAWVDVNA